MHSLESVTDCEDFIVGCLFMGTGGGGDPVEGLETLTAALDDGLTLRWHHADRIDDNALTAMVYGIGSIAPRSDDHADSLREVRLGVGDVVGDDAICLAVRELSDHLGRQIGCLVAAELGAANAPGPIVAAAQLGIPIVDGDYSGRAIPEEMQSTPFAHGISSDPLAAVDRWGNTVIVKKTVNPYMLERIARHIAIASFDEAAIASTPLAGRDMKGVLVPGTLSLCLEIGRACRVATEAGHDPVAVALEVVAGWRLFDGVVVSKEWEDSGGFMIGTLKIRGTGAWEGHVLRTWFKNETHVTWLDGQPWVCSPDLVTLVDPRSARGFTNTDIGEGDEVVAVGMAGLELLRQPDTLRNGTGPAYYGFDVPYVPIERLMQYAPRLGRHDSA
ncbi:DUF917 domain-containing protein [Candidatus Poriferisodalis sp.]|uniref:DUF917 domain-containing protein n=1 Tax=Candidatus Poriferisodalis sp. TaxID=3101277 RepID=UPI003B5AFD93